MSQVLTPKVRSWVYKIALAGLSLLVVYGIVDDALMPAWVNLVGALLGITASGTAVAYRPTRVPQDAPDINPDLDLQGDIDR